MLDVTCASDGICVDIRLCRAGEPSNDLLSQQSTADAVYDARVPQCCLQVSCSNEIYDTCHCKKG